MSDATVSLIIALVGVGGTLASSVLTQLLSQRARVRELEDSERVRVAEQQRSDEQRKVDQLRNTYVQLHSRDRHYRDAMLAHAYALKAGSADTEADELRDARRAQRDTRAEAQMIAGEEVLAAEGRLNYQLTVAYRGLMKAAREPHSPERAESLDHVVNLLDTLAEDLAHLRVLMRADLGVAQEDRGRTVGGSNGRRASSSVET